MRRGRSTNFGSRSWLQKRRNVGRIQLTPADAYKRSRDSPHHAVQKGVGGYADEYGGTLPPDFNCEYLTLRAGLRSGREGVKVVAADQLGCRGPHTRQVKRLGHMPSVPPVEHGPDRSLLNAVLIDPRHGVAPRVEPRRCRCQLTDRDIGRQMGVERLQQRSVVQPCGRAEGNDLAQGMNTAVGPSSTGDGDDIAGGRLNGGFQHPPGPCGHCAAAGIPEIQRRRTRLWREPFERPSHQLHASQGCTVAKPDTHAANPRVTAWTISVLIGQILKEPLNRFGVRNAGNGLTPSVKIATLRQGDQVVNVAPDFLRTSQGGFDLAMQDQRTDQVALQRTAL